MRRSLSPEERSLWDEVRRSARALRRQQGARVEPPPSPAVKADPPRPAPAAVARAAPAAPPSAPPLARLEDRTRRRLARGLIAVESRIDLHGMRQERAFAALFAFLRHAQARGERIVLVVTGKGRVGEDGRGVLRQSVPHWLARAEFRDLVGGFEEAARKHGGEGALYVRVRRRREARPPRA